MRFTLEKLGQRIGELRHYRYRNRIPVTNMRMVADQHSLVMAAMAEGKMVRPGDRWGGRDESVWFFADLSFPEEWKQQDVIGLFHLGLTGGGNCSGYEALVYLNGMPSQALDRNHPELYLPRDLVDEGRADLAIKAWSGLNSADGGGAFDHRIEQMELACLDEAADDFYFTSLHVWGAVQVLQDTQLEKHALLTALDEAFMQVDWREPGSDIFYRSIRQARDILAGRLKEMPRGPRPQVTAVGHCHIDVAWLWRLSHTREKSARSWSTVLRLMERYPEYVFLQSQPQLYKYLKQDYPELYAQIKERVKEGRWEPTGAMWLESDCNIPSGESLVRQILYGKRFFREEFGVDNNMLWLPDVFGYSWALPQILKKSGIDAFMTTKISWNQYNRFPHDTFHWRGIDGTEVFTHFVTTPNNDGSWYYTYNGDVKASSVHGIWENYRQKDVNDRLLIAYGWGDGGGGPTRDMLEAVRRFRDMPGMPQLAPGRAEDFFEDLRGRVSDHPHLPLWDGELYLEYHRGTYTSQAYNKRMNRRMEALLHDAECLGVMANLQNPQYSYPQQELADAWEIVLRNQFHDIIPGSSIQEVYEDSRAEYSEAEMIVSGVLREAAAALLGTAPDSRGKGPSLAVLNTLGWTRDGLVEIPWSPECRDVTWHSEGGEALETQPTFDAEGSPKTLLIQTRSTPAYGYTVLHARGGVCTDEGTEPVCRVNGSELESPCYRIQLNEHGHIVSLIDKRRNRQVLKPDEPANLLQVFEDKPMAHEAWDIDIYYQEKMWVISDLAESAVEENGPLRFILRLVWRFQKSTIVQRVTLYKYCARIDFVTEVDWHEQQLLLKAAFPVDIRTTKATYDIQFGNVERPNHWNTSWDWARFESAAQKWCDLSERDYGVSLLNDCKYGHDIRNHVIRLSLIKSAVYPDRNADQGRHEFTYSLFPHESGWLQAGTHRAACELNEPLTAVPINAASSIKPPSFGLVSCDADHVMIDTVKKAEDGDDVIIRLYEFGGCRGMVTLNLNAYVAQHFSGSVETNLLEEPEAGNGIRQEGTALSLSVKPYEIKTMRLKRTQNAD